MLKKIMLIFLSASLIYISIPVEKEEVNAATYPGGVSGRGAILMEEESGRVLFEKDAHTPMRIASITKIMTAVLAIESEQLDDWVTISENAEGTEGSSIYLVAGEKIKLRDLVYGLMLRSGNDAAVAIAEHVGGSLEGFVMMMNQKREEIGMLNSAFANPHGLDDHEEHYSTAYDMALLTKYAMEMEEYKEITSTKHYRTEGNEGENYRIFNNKNRLLTQLYEYCTGGKTGYTKRANRTLVTTASKDDVNLIAVTINAPSDWNDHISLYEWAFSNFKIFTVIQEGIVKSVDDDYYRNKVIAEYTFEYPLSEEETENLNTRLVLYKPPTDDRWEEDGHPYPIGTLQIELNNEVIGVVPLKYIEEKEEKAPFWKQWVDQLFMTAGVRGHG
ncbi:D-alanyl-D-alanine carboxypeptidase family protein [Evansella tamaricis]|uniref:D-alanyl-D-alanine carboxypeptidase n=1 Tax=Evansella tamaricis TaxID=2069301 RepID=A0ABS6JKT3_9BACI|nr:D-alanyl-D-alanine carboxypeptidase family protein [Evansella tamaricis]MBU9714295.1 D-alanyl-D-alanine carboxypeptidase [Evansella tamaricis]